jgi:NitT/TauT family transport system substrate-binding protein
MQVLVPEWLELNGVPRDAINLMQLDPAIVVNSLVEGQIDAGECWKGNSMPIFHKRAAASDLEIGWIPYSAFGLDIYGNGIVTSEKLMEENPELVRSFLDATYRGYQWVHDNPDGATDIITSHYPVLDKEITRQQITELMELMSGGKSLGWLEEDKVSRTLDFLAGAYGVEEGMTVDDIYSTAFLDSGT